MANLFAAFVGTECKLYPLSNYRNSHCTGELCPFGNAHRGQRANYAEFIRRTIQNQKIKGGNDMEIIQTQTRDGEVRLEYKGLRLQVWANSTRKGWELWILHNEPKRFNTTLLGVERRTFKERTIMTKWVKSLR